MSYCQYEYTKRRTRESNVWIYEIQCVWCYQTLWIPKGDLPKDWCTVRPETRPYMQCKHLGKSHRKMPNKLCGACRGQDVPVFLCDIHSICSEKPLGHNQKMMHCLKCFTDGLGFEAKENDNATHPSGTRLPAASPSVD